MGAKSGRLKMINKIFNDDCLEIMDRLSRFENKSKRSLSQEDWNIKKLKIKEYLL